MNPMASLLSMVIISEPWIDDALCAEVGGDDHFATQKDPSAVGRAKALCARCEVVAECLEYAIRAKEPIGTWGGRSQPELRRLRRGAP